MSFRGERLYVAVNALAAGTGTLRERFENAHNLGLSALGRDDFPEEDLGRLFDDIQHALAEVLPLAERRGGLGFAMDVLSEKQIEGIAEQVVSLFYGTVQVDTRSVD